MASFFATGEASLEWLCPAWRWPVLLAAIWLLHTTTVAVYRLTWHPLASFPGPVLARASYMYEFWFEVILEGRYTRRIEKLHQKYDTGTLANGYSMYPSLRVAGVGTEDHDHHRLRRGAVIKFFSRAHIMKCEHVIHEKVQQLCEKLLLYRDQGPFRVAAAYSCFTTDALTQFCFGESLGDLEAPGWNPSFEGTIDEITGLFYLTRHLPPLARLVDVMPLSLCRLLSTQISSLLQLIRVTVPRLVERARSTNETHAGETTQTVVETILESGLPPAEKSPERVTSEAVAFVLGGTHPISAVLSIATFHLLNKPDKLERLRTELHTVVSDETDLPPWSTLEKLPYLSAVVLESLRLVYGVASRVSVVAPDEELVYTPAEQATGAPGDARTCYTIPPGSAIGISSYMIHTDPTLFPDGSEFIPDRWLDEHGQRERGLEKYLMSFSKGHRQCIGMHLAYCEIYIGVTALALRVWPRMSLFDTTVSDIAYDHDQLIYMPKKGSKGVQAVMH
ncbi:hypothetical protein ACJZ2D_000506 [Fusarium nematophilum]